MKAILLLIFMTLKLFSMDFKDFKQKALNETNRLKSAKLSIDIAQKKSLILQQYENPSIEFEGADFEDERGWRVGFSQPFRLPNVGNDLEDLAHSLDQESKTAFLYLRADFAKELEIKYSEYVYQKKLESLIQKELNLASRVENITKIRLKNGMGTRAQRMMATLEKEDVENRIIEQKMSVDERYFSLFSLANIVESIDLEADFIYPLSPDDSVSTAQNPTLLKISKQQNRFEKEAQTLNHSIKSIELFGELEREPDQDIQRIGIALSLPLFNTNKQKSELLKIRANQSALLLKELKIKEQLEIKTLQKNISNLGEQYKASKKQQIKLNKLLELFEDGYKISKGSLLELIDVKNRVIKKQIKLLQIQKESNLKQIQLNFIQGKYND